MYNIRFQVSWNQTLVESVVIKVFMWCIEKCKKEILKIQLISANTMLVMSYRTFLHNFLSTIYLNKMTSLQIKLYFIWIQLGGWSGSEMNQHYWKHLESIGTIKSLKRINKIQFSIVQVLDVYNTSPMSKKLFENNKQLVQEFLKCLVIFRNRLKIKQNTEK